MPTAGGLGSLRWLLAPVIVGSALRFATLAHQSFWVDESATLSILHHSLGSVLPAVRASESTPPLYYLLAWLWAHGLGFGEVGVRSLSALCGTATVVAVAVVARRIGGVRAGAGAAWIVALDPVLFWYSQEARAYGLFALLSVISLGSMLSLRARPSVRRAAGWTAVCVAAGATHYFAGFLVGAELCVLLACPGPALTRRALIPSTLVFAAAAVPLGLLAHAQYGNSAFVRGQGLPRAVVQTAGQLLVGYGVDPVMVICAVVSAVGLALCLYPVVTRWGRQPADLRLLALATGLGVLAPLIVAVGGAQLIDTRNLLFVLPAVAVLAGVGSTQGRGWAIALPVLAGAVVVTHIYFDPTLQRTDYRGAARAIGPALEQRAILVRMSGATDLAQYLEGLHPVGAAGSRVGEIVILGMTMGGGLNREVASLASLRFVTPPGFREVSAVAGQTYSLRRFRAPQAVRETVRDLERRAGGAVQVLLQAARG